MILLLRGGIYARSRFKQKDDQKNEHDSDILQAEIGALLFNMGKTCVDFWKKRNYFPNANNYFNEFSSYRDYYLKDYFYDELYKVSPKLKKFFPISK